MDKIYNCKHNEMLMGVLVLCQNFRRHKDLLLIYRTAWEDPFIDDFEKETNFVLDHYLGTDPYRDQKSATLLQTGGRKIT